EQCEAAADCPGSDECHACVCGSESLSSAAAAHRKKTTTTTTATTSTSTSRVSTTSTASNSTSTTRPTTTTSSTSTSRPRTTTQTGSSTSTTVPGQLFEAPNPWNSDVSSLPKSATSDGIVQALAAAGGWGLGSMRIDFSIEVLQADATTP